MIKNIVHQYILEQLIYFKNGNRCCQQFCGSFRSSEHLIFVEYAFKLGFNSRPFVQNGIQTIKVFKKYCLHYVERVPELHLQTQTEKDLFMLQCQSDFIGSQLEMQMSPEFFSPNCIRPSIPPHRFSLGLKQSMARQNKRGQKSFQETCYMQSYKTLLLDAIRRSRVLVVNGDSRYEKSTALPMYIIENCAERHAHCKIICVEREQLLAIHNSERLSEHLGEKVGNTVAFQIHLQSRISEGSNLIYTTSSFLLRVLMGQSIVDSFRHISHVVVCDVYRHEAFADLLLCELRAALRCHAHLKIILLSDSQPNLEFLEYFGEGEVFQLEVPEAETHNTSILHLEDIRKMLDKERNTNSTLAYMSPPTVSRMFNGNYCNVDHVLEHYESTGTEQALEAFLYVVRGEFISINYRHSVTGRTAIIIAAKLGKSSHLQTLLEMFADPFIMDKQNLNAVSNAIAGGNVECIELLNSYSGCRASKNIMPASLDYNLVMDLIRLLTTSSRWEPGHIVIIVSDYEQLLRLNFSVLRHKMIGDIPQQIAIYMLHSNVEKEQLESTIEGATDCINIIIATDIIENINLYYSCAYVIDSARVRRTAYNAETCCKEVVYEWVSREALENRMKLANRYKGKPGTCFRLIPSFLLDQLPANYSPELLTMPLDRICLTVKLLSPHTMIAEYLQGTISRPSFIHVHTTVEFLKKIDVFDEFEEITWLGCRLIDVPIDCQLGKLLVFAILLQCLDPVLTIVSFLSTFDPLEIPNEIGNKYQAYIDIVRHKIKEERKRLSEGIQSDHLIYLRLYQEWQNDLRDDNPEMALIDEHQYVLNGILEKVCDIRTHLVGALRSSQLIHNQGQLSMHYINLKSNSWSMIKATLVAGLYPNVCLIDSTEARLKCNRPRELVLHPISVLRDLTMEPLTMIAQDFPSLWIVYGNEINSLKFNSISCCTLVSPFTVAMFAGPPKINLTSLSAADYSDRHSQSERGKSGFYLDDWIEFKLKSSDAQLVLKTRQYLYCAYMNFLQNCGSVDKWRRTNIPLTPVSRLFDTLDKVLSHEDNSCGFVKPLNVGLRPKAVPNKFISTFNNAISWEQGQSFVDLNTIHISPNIVHNKNKFSEVNCKLTCLERQYFMVYTTESDAGYRKYSLDWLRESVTRVVEPCLSPDKLTYIIMYNKHPDQFCSVALAKKLFGVFRLQEYFKNIIPLSDIINICSKHNLCIPSFNEKRAAIALDPIIGKMILDLFAFRNNWLHNN